VPKSGLVLEECACFNLRKASRAVTRFFDDALAPAGLRATQLAILMAARSGDAPSIARLADELVLEPSTLNRNLKPLEKEGLLSVETGTTGRRKLVLLTAKGQSKVDEAIPLWEKAQNAIVGNLGDEDWAKLKSTLEETVQLAN